MKKVFIILLLFFSYNIYSQQNTFKDNSKGFVENKGQIITQQNRINKNALYLLATPGLNVQLRKTGFSYDFYEMQKTTGTKKNDDSNFIGNTELETDEIIKYKIHRVDFDFENINPDVKIIPLNQCQGYDNYYNLPYSGEVTNVLKYKEILYKNIYNNVDLHFFIPEDPQKPVEYNFIIHEGGRVDDIRFNIAGAKTQLDSNSIKIKLRFGEMKETIPLSWTEDDKHEAITINYKRTGKNQYGFTSPNAISNKKIVIDPVPIRLWGSYFGSDSSAFPTNIISDSANNIYISGSTSSPVNIATEGTHQSTIEGNGDGYLVKFSPDGQRIWGTYYATAPKNITLDTDLNIIFSGNTFAGAANISSPGSYQPVKNNYNEIYLVKLNPSGIRLWGTYYGGEQNDYCYGLTTDTANNIYFTGETNSGQYISTPGSYQEVIGNSPGNNSDGLIVKFSPAGQRIWGTYYGGERSDGFFTAQFSNDGFLYLAGGSDSSTSISTPGTFQETNNGRDGIIVKFSVSGIRVWGTYIGGEGGESILNIGKLKGDNFYLHGRTTSQTNIATPGSFMPTFPNVDLESHYIINFNVVTQQKIWGTYYTSQITGLDANAAGEVFFCGDTSNDTDISTPDAYMPVKGTYNKSYLIKLNNVGQRVWGTYYGGEKAEQICYLTLDTVGDIYMHGMCNGSLSGIATENAYQTSIPPQTMSTYIVKFRDCESSSAVSSNSPICIGEDVELHALGGTSYSWTGPNGFVSTEQNPVIPQASELNTGTYSCYISGTGCDATIELQIIIGDTSAPVPSLAVLPDISGECNISVATVPTANDNCSGIINAVTTDPMQYNTIGSYTINWQYTDGNGNIATQQQAVIVNPASGIVINPEASFSQCEAETNIFNLPSINSQITTETGTLITFYLSREDALSGTSPINNPESFPTDVNSDVYALVILPGGCRAVTTVHLILNAVPVMQSAVLTKCFGSGIATFDLTEAQNMIVASNTLTLSYYASQNDLDTNVAIVDTTNFSIAGTSQTIYVKGIDNNGCSSVVELQVNASQIIELNLPDHNECADPDGNDIHFYLSQHNNEIEQMLPADNYTFSYYDNYNEAYNGTINSVPETYAFSSGFREIFYRVTGTSACPYIIKLKLNIIGNPRLEINPQYSFCKGSEVTITISNIYDTYQWSTGSTNTEVVISQAGEYSLTVGKTTNGNMCYTTKHFTVIESEEPQIDNIVIKDFTDNDNSITVYPNNEEYQYSLDGITYQYSNIFTGLASGIYTIHVRDSGECGIAVKKIVLLVYPKYFSPNADGKSDFWHIKNSYFAEKMVINIYDRFGKVLASLNQNSPGWDGTYNGNPMPATDYWFVFTKQDGTELKGHFSLLR